MARPRLLLFLGLLATTALGQTEPPPLPRPPSPSHTPEISVPAPDDAPGYRAGLVALTERYVHLYYNADLVGALGESRTGLGRAVKAGNRADQAQFLKSLGYVSWLLGDTAAALDYEQRLLALADHLNDDRLRTYAHRTLGTVYRQIGEITKAREHTDSALVFAERTGDEALRYGVLNNLGVFALDAGDLGTARRLHLQVLAYRERVGDPWDLAGCLSNLADVATAEQNLAEALAYNERALRLRREIGDQRGIVRSLRQVACSLRLLGRTDEALAHLDEALTRAQKITGHELLRDIWQEFALTREARGEFAAALAAERQLGQAREALAGDHARTRIAELEARYNDARKQETIERLEREQRLQAAEFRAQQAELGRVRLRNLLLGISLAGGMILLGSVIGMQRARLRAERLARDTAERAAELKSGLLRMVFHDIRAPVGNILLMAEDWQQSADRAAQQDERVHIILHEARRVQQLAQDLLDAASLEAGALRLTMAPVRMAELTTSALARLEASAAKKQQRLELKLPPDEPCLIKGDAARLDQVIQNLVGNAIKYSPRGSTVQIALQPHDRMIRLTVQDSGPGIAPLDLDRLFQPFSRLAAKTTGGESSHGLGLSIAQDLVKLHGGQIRVESLPGQGALFIVNLPAGT